MKKRKAKLLAGEKFRAICHHEAGHAVACYMYKISIRFVTVEPEDKYLGLVKTHVVRVRERLEDWRIRRPRLLAERFVRVCLAGEIAQKRYSKKSFSPYHSKYDWDIAVNVAAKICGNLEEALAWCHFLYLNTRNELTGDRNWKAVKALANRLKTEKRLGAREARRIIETTIYS